MTAVTVGTSSRHVVPRGSWEIPNRKQPAGGRKKFQRESLNRRVLKTLSEEDVGWGRSVQGISQAEITQDRGLQTLEKLSLLRRGGVVCCLVGFFFKEYGVEGGGRRGFTSLLPFFTLWQEYFCILRKF